MIKAINGDYMRKGYPKELRELAVSCLKKMTYKEVSKLLNISISALQDWKNLELAGNIYPIHEDVRHTPKNDHQAIADYMKEHSDLYLYEIAEKFNRTASTVHYIGKKFSISYKKKA